MLTTRSIPKASRVPSGEIAFDENAVIFCVTVPSSLLHGVEPVVAVRPEYLTIVVDRVDFAGGGVSGVRGVIAKPAPLALVAPVVK